MGRKRIWGSLLYATCGASRTQITASMHLLLSITHRARRRRVSWSDWSGWAALIPVDNSMPECAATPWSPPRVFLYQKCLAQVVAMWGMSLPDFGGTVLKRSFNVPSLSHRDGTQFSFTHKHDCTCKNQSAVPVEGQRVKSSLSHQVA